MLQSVSTLSQRCVVTFSSGIIVGFGFAYLLLGAFTWENTEPFLQSSDFLLRMKEKNTAAEHFPSSSVDISSESENLTQKVRVLCWIMTAPRNHRHKARAVKETWGKRCDILLFISTKKSSILPTVVVDVEEGYQTLWGKTKKAFAYVYENYLNDADWFLKADDDTYIVMENLRYMLSSHSPDEPVYFGRKFRIAPGKAYMSGGAGYVLSREALKRFVEVALPDGNLCMAGEDGAEDKEMGRCLENVNVTSGVSRDTSGRGRFFPFAPEHHLVPKYFDDILWYWKYTNTTSTEGADCCSDSAISFHYIEPDQMYVLDYFIYHMHPYGTHIKPLNSIPPKPSSETLYRLALDYSVDVPKEKQ